MLRRLRGRLPNLLGLRGWKGPPRTCTLQAPGLASARCSSNSTQHQGGRGPSSGRQCPRGQPPQHSRPRGRVQGPGVCQPVGSRGASGRPVLPHAGLAASAAGDWPRPGCPTPGSQGLASASSRYPASGPGPWCLCSWPVVPGRQGTPGGHDPLEAAGERGFTRSWFQRIGTFFHLADPRLARPAPGVGETEPRRYGAPHPAAVQEGSPLGWGAPCPHPALLPFTGFQEQLVSPDAEILGGRPDRCDRFSLSPRQ